MIEEGVLADNKFLPLHSLLWFVVHDLNFQLRAYLACEDQHNEICDNS